MTEDPQRKMMLSHQADFVARELGDKSEGADGLSVLHRFEEGALVIEARKWWKRGLTVSYDGQQVFSDAGPGADIAYTPGEWEAKLDQVYARARERFIVQVERRREDTMRMWDASQRDYY